MKHNEENTQDRLLDREALSALMDNELSDFELRRLLQRVEQKPELLAEWERLSLVRAALQPDPLRFPSSPDFASRVMADIDQSIAHAGPLSASVDKVSSPRQPGSANWIRNTSRFAVAASVTFAVFMGMQAVLQNPGAGDSMPAVASGDSADSIQTQNQQLAVDADAQQRLNDYIRSVTIPARVESQSAP
ncbi:MAG: sigma-E factor negative regulatory protein, partial [Pseudohongiella sp.]